VAWGFQGGQTKIRAREGKGEKEKNLGCSGESFDRVPPKRAEGGGRKSEPETPPKKKKWRKYQESVRAAHCSFSELGGM